MTLSMQDQKAQALAAAWEWWASRPFPQDLSGRPYGCDVCGAPIAVREGTSLVGSTLRCASCTQRWEPAGPTDLSTGALPSPVAPPRRPRRTWLVIGLSAIALLGLVAGLLMWAPWQHTKSATTPAGPSPSAARFEGTWTQTALSGFSSAPIVVTKAGDAYTFTGVDATTEQLVMIHTDPDQSGNMTIYALGLDPTTRATRSGDTLTFTHADKTVQVTVSGDTMTWTITGISGVFTFARTAQTG